MTRAPDIPPGSTRSGGARGSALPSGGLRVWIAAAAGLAILLRGALGLASPGAMGDTASYVACAERVVALLTCPQPSDFPFFRAPGYPVFLALTDGGGVGTLLAQALLDGGTTVLLGLLATSLLGAVPGVVTAFAYALYPFALSFASTVQTETLYTFLAVGSFVALVRIRDSSRPAAWAILAGILTGLATVTRPGHQLLLPLLLLWCAWIWWRERRPAALLGLVGGAAAILVPAVVAATLHHPGFVGLTNGAWFAFWLGNGPPAEALYSVSAEEYAALEREIWLRIVPERMDALAGAGLAEREAYWRGEALEWIAANPVEWLGVKVRALLHTFRPWVDPRSFGLPVVAASVGATLVALWAGLAGLVAARRDTETDVDGAYVVLFLLPLLAVVGLNLLFQPHIRFRAALVDPLLLPFGVYLLLRVTGLRGRGVRIATTPKSGPS